MERSLMKQCIDYIVPYWATILWSVLIPIVVLGFLIGLIFVIRNVIKKQKIFDNKIVIIAVLLISAILGWIFIDYYINYYLPGRVVC